MQKILFHIDDILDTPYSIMEKLKGTIDIKEHYRRNNNSFKYYKKLYDVIYKYRNNDILDTGTITNMTSYIIFLAQSLKNDFIDELGNKKVEVHINLYPYERDMRLMELFNYLIMVFGPDVNLKAISKPRSFSLYEEYVYVIDREGLAVINREHIENGIKVNEDNRPIVFVPTYLENVQLLKASDVNIETLFTDIETIYKPNVDLRFLDHTLWNIKIEQDT